MAFHTLLGRSLIDAATAGRWENDCRILRQIDCKLATLTSRNNNTTEGYIPINDAARPSVVGLFWKDRLCGNWALLIVVVVKINVPKVDRVGRLT